MNEIKAPNTRTKLNIKNDQVGQVEKKDFLTPHNYSSLNRPHWSNQFVARGGGIKSLLLAMLAVDLVNTAAG